MSTNESANSDDEQEVYADLDNTPGSSNQVVHGAPVTSDFQFNAPAGWNHPHPTPYGHQNHGLPGQYTHQQYDPGHQNMMTSQYPQQYNHGQQNLMTSQFQDPDFVNQRATNYQLHPPFSTNPNMPSGSMTSYPWGQSSSNATFGMNPVYDQSTVNYGPFQESESDRIGSHMTHAVIGHPVTSQYGDMSVENSAMSNLALTSPSTSRHLTPTPQLAPNTGTNKKRKSKSPMPRSSGKRKGKLTPTKSTRRSYDPNDPLNKEIPDGVKFDTKKLCDEVKESLKRFGISQRNFSVSVLDKDRQCAKIMLRKTGQLDKKQVETIQNFCRMFNWTKMSDVQKLACFRKCPKQFLRNEFDAELPDNVNIDTANILRRVQGEISLHSITMNALARKVLGQTGSCLDRMLKKPEPWYNMDARAQLKFRRLYNYIQLPEETRAAFFRPVKLQKTEEK